MGEQAREAERPGALDVDERAELERQTSGRETTAEEGMLSLM